MAIFQDYIPEGEDTGALGGDGGFQDFVPDREPELQVVEEVEVDVPEGAKTEKPTKKGK